MAEHDSSARNMDLTHLARKCHATLGAQFHLGVGNGATNPIGVTHCFVRGGDRDAGRRLGLAIHEPKVPPFIVATVAPLSGDGGVEAATCLGDLAHGQELSWRSSGGRQQVEGVRHGAQGGHASPRHLLPESGIRDRTRRQDDTGTHRQMRVEDRQSIAVAEGQSRHGDVLGTNTERIDDSLGVGHQVVEG